MMLIVAVSVILLAGQVYAGGLMDQEQNQGQGQAQGQAQGQIQGQVQGQGQLQGQNNDQVISPSQVITVENPREYLAIPGVGVYVPSLIPGQIRDVTKEFFLPVGLKAMSGKNTYIEVKSFNGWALFGPIQNRICLEDIEEVVLKKFLELSKTWAEPSRIRVSIWMKAATIGGGGSIGGSYGGSVLDGGTGFAGAIAGAAGLTESITNPYFNVKFFRLPYVKK